MGIKFLSLQMIPWCFHMMGSTTTCFQPGPSTTPSTPDGGSGGKAPTGSIKLIRMDGRVEVYDRRVSASELMSEHPRHLVCRSDAFTIGQRVPSLPEGEELQPGHAYFLLPLHFFQSVLSFVTVASSLALLQGPFDVRKTPSGKLQIRVSDDFVERVREAPDGGGGGGGRVCTTAALEKDYRQLVAESRARHWKPKLETIRESEMGRGRVVSVASALAALGIIGRRGKDGDHDGHRQKQRQWWQQQQQQRQQKPQRQHQQQKQRQMLSVIAHHLSSSYHNSMGKKVVACNV